MFLGVSKNVGNGFRVGVGTKIGGSKKPSSKDLQTTEFREFLKKVENDMNEALVIFVEANGKDFKKLEKSKADLDEVFKDNPKYHEFIGLFRDKKMDIDKILYSGDSGVVAKRAITDSIFELKAFLNKEYPGFKPKYKIRQESILSRLFKFIAKAALILFIFAFLVAFFADKPNSKETQNTAKSTSVK